MLSAGEGGRRMGLVPDHQLRQPKALCKLEISCKKWLPSLRADTRPGVFLEQTEQSFGAG